MKYYILYQNQNQNMYFKKDIFLEWSVFHNVGY